MLHNQLKVRHPDLAAHFCQVASCIRDPVERGVALDLVLWQTSAAHRCCFLPVDYNWIIAPGYDDVLDATVLMSRVLLGLKARQFRDPTTALLVGRVRHIHAVLRASLIVHGCRNAPAPERCVAEMIALDPVEMHALAEQVLRHVAKRPQTMSIRVPST